MFFLIGFAEGNVEKCADAARKVERVRARENGRKKLLAWLLAIYTPCATSCRQAISCPQQIRSNPVVEQPELLKPGGAGKVSRRRAVPGKTAGERILCLPKELAANAQSPTRRCRRRKSKNATKEGHEETNQDGDESDRQLP